MHPRSSAVSEVLTPARSTPDRPAARSVAAASPSRSVLGVLVDSAAVTALVGCGVWLWWRGRRSNGASALPGAASRHSGSKSASSGRSDRDASDSQRQSIGSSEGKLHQSVESGLSGVFSSWSDAELSRLQSSAEWLEQRRLRAVKAGDEWQRRQAGKQASYGRWSMMRDVSSQQRWRQQVEAERERSGQTEQQRHDTVRGGSHYWQWYDEGRQQQHEPHFTWQRTHSHSTGLPSAVVQAGETLGLPHVSDTVPLAATSSTAVWSVADIKAAFKRRALLTHPDMPNGDQQQFQVAAQAYDTLITFVYQQQANIKQH